MLAILGLLTVVVVLGLILIRATTPLVALIVVPVASAIVAGFGTSPNTAMPNIAAQTIIEY